MKRLIISLAIAFVAMGAAQAQEQKECCKAEKECCKAQKECCKAQKECCKAEKKECCKAQKKEKVTVVKIEDNNIFSQCFKDIDTNGDGIVDCCEAKKATFLSLERGGRSNVITNYDFLKFFPNLTALGVGTTPLEVIDLHKQKKLEKLNVSNASELKKIILAEGCKPEISGQNNAQVEYVKCEKGKGM
jgi:hypothetical protein